MVTDGDYESTTTLLDLPPSERLDLADALDSMRRIDLGSALAWRGRHDEAIAALEPVPLDLVPDPWAAEARWTLHLALRGAGQDAPAGDLLVELASEPGELGERA